MQKATVEAEQHKGRGGPIFCNQIIEPAGTEYMIHIWNDRTVEDRPAVQAVVEEDSQFSDS